MTSLCPLTFTPVLKDYIWGGRNLETRFGRRLPPTGTIAESWEIAAHPDGDAVVDNGPFAGASLTQMHARLGLDLIGRNNMWAQERGKFPLLIKLLDATRPLSVQVHPDDAYALEHEGNELGKSEMWVILHAEPDAAVILGVAPGATPDSTRRAIAGGALEPLLHRIPVKTGDHVCVPAGSLHAILGGILIAEIQQNSNTTYRVYDWNRVGDDGRPRPLHVDRALDVINFEQVAPTLPKPHRISHGDGVTRYALCTNRYFTVERLALEAGATFDGCCDGRTLEIWGAIAGEVSVRATQPDTAQVESLAAVRFALLPAAMGDFTITAETEATVLRAYVPAQA